MNSINLKDLILYFVTANAFFFMTLHAENEMLVFPFGMLLLILLFIYLIRINQKYNLE